MLLDNVTNFPRDQWRKARWSPATWKQQLKKFAELRKHRFDVGLDLQGHSKTALCLRISNPKKRIAAFATDNLSQRLNPQLPGNPDEKHRIERMMDALNCFGDFGFAPNPIMPKPKALAEIGITGERPIASISTGAGAVVKQYPADRWSEIGMELQKQGYQVVLLGAQPDPRVTLTGAQDMVAKLNLFDTMSVVANSALHLAADTGTGHMAAAYGVPFVSIFGPTDPKLYRPYSEVGTVLRHSDRPESVTVQDVLQAVQNLGIHHGQTLPH